MKISRLLAVGFGSATLVVMGSSAAFAGEATGSGGTTPIAERANSICAYSGLNDEITAEEPDRTQSYGQIVRAGFKAFAPPPSMACNGRTGFLAGGGEE